MLYDIDGNQVVVSGADTLSKLAGKTILFDGDSITEKNFRASKNYHDYLAQWYGFTVINKAVSGTGLKKNTGAIDRLPDYPTDIDAYVYMGNMNDGTSDDGITELGQYGDTQVTTAYGAIATFLDMLVEKYPTTPILIISSTPRTQNGVLGLCYGTQNWFAQWVEAWKKLCADRDIPFLDLYGKSNLRPWNDAHNMEYFLADGYTEPDGIHPNAKGQLIMAQQIAPFLVSNIV